MKKRMVFAFGVILLLGVLFGTVTFGRELTVNRDEFRNIFSQTPFPIVTRTVRPMPSSISLPRNVILPTLPPLPTILSLPTPTPKPTPKPTANNAPLYQIPVLSLKYFPPDPSDPTKLNRTVVGTDLSDLSLSYVRNRITSVQNATIDALERGSTFHGYKDSGAKSVFDYRIYEEKEFLKPVPVKVSGNDRNADHVKILTEDVNICDLVNNRGVKEVWLWMYHSDVVGPIESYQRGSYGGLGNGYMDLPLCNKTYTVYDYNYGRGVGEAVEDHGHHIERVMGSVNSSVWNGQFVGECGQKAFYRCGWTHYPPNVMQYCSNHDYDWANEASVLSDCEDWRPDGSGVKKQVSCHNWAGEICGNDSGDKFKVWWMQNIPSAWWVWIGDYDGAKQRGAGLL